MVKTIQDFENEQIARATRLAEAVKPLLEPAGAEAYLPEAATISLAISMKRIADEICGTKESYGISQSIADAIERSILNAARR